MSFLSDLLGSAYKEGMTEDEINAALETAKVGTEETHTAHFKKLLSDANAEAAKYKKQLREKQTTDEKAAAEKEEEQQKLIDKIAELEKSNKDLNQSISISTHTSKLIAQGYDEKLAAETAKAMVEGDMDKVLANQAKFVESVKQDAIAGKMRNTQKPGAGTSGADNGMDYDKMIATAQANGDMATAAYYTRLQQQAGQNETIE